MAKVVVYALITMAFILFITFLSTNRHSNKQHSSTGLNRRLGYKFPIPNFDPLVVKMQRFAEEKGYTEEGKPINLEKNSYAAKIEDADAYFSSDGNLNVTSRLLFLFPLVDIEPEDGLISFKELEKWNTEQAMERLSYRTRKEMTFYDLNKDGEISFTEYLPQITNEDIEKNDKGHGEAGWWMEQFRNADDDNNGLLNFDEFNNFLHPEDSDNEAIHKWILRDKMKRTMDEDRDGRLSYLEFYKNVYGDYKSYLEYERGYSALPVGEKFNELDVDKDRFLTVEEMMPMLQYIKPGELSYAKQYSMYLLKEADDNRDGYLSLHEMLKHSYTFYGTMFDYNNGDYNGDNDDDDDDDDDDDFHDEL